MNDSAISSFAREFTAAHCQQLITVLWNFSRIYYDNFKNAPAGGFANDSRPFSFQSTN